MSEPTIIQETLILSAMKAGDADNELPGIIDFKKVTRTELVAFSIRCEKVYKWLKERMDILESNRGKARGMLGELMSAAGELKIEFADATGQKVANLSLDSKWRPSFFDKNEEFAFLRAVGQGEIIKEDVAWQTVEKIMDAVTDELPTVECTAEGLKIEGLEKDVYFQYRPLNQEKTVMIAVVTGEEGEPTSYKDVCKLYQTNTAKVNKIYE